MIPMVLSYLFLLVIAAIVVFAIAERIWSEELRPDSADKCEQALANDDLFEVCRIPRSQ